MNRVYLLINNNMFKNKRLSYKLNMIFCFFFLVPVVGLIYFGIRYDILSDYYWPFFFLFFLCFAFFGIAMLRRVFDEVSSLNHQLNKRIQKNFPQNHTRISYSGDELQQISQSFELLDTQLIRMHAQLHQKTSEIRMLKNLAELCYVTADQDEILFVALERALAVTDSDVGSIMLLNRPARDCFIVRASIGLDEWVKVNDVVEFETSIAKYAVLNKSALVVKDIEKDTRFGHTNRPQYATKSFVCLPIKTSREIIGVLTISRKSTNKIYTNDEIEALEPLLSNAAFTHENLMLLRENHKKITYLKIISNILEIINSSFRGSEMLHACLNEIRSLVPFTLALILKRDIHRPEDIELFELMTNETTLLSKGRLYQIAPDSTIDKVLKQQTIFILANARQLLEDSDFDLSGDQKQRAAILVPLKLDGSINGILMLAAEQVEPLEKNQDFIQWVAWCLSLAIERNRLYDAVVKRNRELDSIKQIGSALASSTFDIKQVLNYTMDMIRVIMNAEAGALYLVDEGELEFAVSFNIDAHQQKKVKLKLGQGIPGYVAARGEPMVVNENQSMSLFLPEVNVESDFDIRSALCVPMISQGRVIGVIEVMNKINGDFGYNDQDLLQSIASSVSIAIENANLYKETVAMAEKERSVRRMFQKFVPKAVLDKILHGLDSGNEMAVELKTLTLINVDIRGFSDLVKILGPQKTVSLLNSFFSLMGGIVFKYHGIVDKYLGDGFLAIFGAPVSSVTDTDNAIVAALEMQSSLSQINGSLGEELDGELKIGISIHTGEVVVGNIGFEMKMDYTVIGDAVNDVFRLQDFVRPFPNSIFFSEKTLHAARSGLNYIELDQRLDKMKIYELLGPAH